MRFQHSLTILQVVQVWGAAVTNDVNKVLAPELQNGAEDFFDIYGCESCMALLARRRHMQVAVSVSRGSENLLSQRVWRRVGRRAPKVSDGSTTGAKRSLVVTRLLPGMAGAAEPSAAGPSPAEPLRPLLGELRGTERKATGQCESVRRGVIV